MEILLKQFFYDGSQKYFHHWHGAAAVLALIVLLYLSFPQPSTLQYTLSNVFRNVLTNKIKFKKDRLLSVTDFFMGPFKDGTEKTWDY